MVNIPDLLCELCENDLVYQPDIDLVDSGLLDSYAIIELISRLEDEGVFIQLTRIDRSKLRTVKGIEELVKENTRS